MSADDANKEAAIRARQMACVHTFIKGVADSFPSCPRCGVSESAWEGMKDNLFLSLAGSQASYGFSNQGNNNAQGSAGSNQATPLSLGTLSNTIPTPVELSEQSLINILEQIRKLSSIPLWTFHE